LRDLKLHNVIVRYADGSDGLPEAAPLMASSWLPQLLPVTGVTRAISAGW